MAAEVVQLRYFAGLTLPEAADCLAISPRTAANDKGHKFAAYELHGVQEYWILDPEKLDHHFYRRTGDMFSEFGTGDEVIVASSIPGFWVKRSWLNPSRLPNVAPCLAEILSSRKAAARKRRG